MSAPELYLGGKRLTLANRIGRGGQGEVYLLPGEIKKAVKVYHPGKRDAETEEKVKTMVRLSLAGTSSLVSFPEDIVTLKSGDFAGFTMRLVEGFRPIHELYGPKSRKLNYPKADYRFLIRSAANLARAVGQVHSAPCVIGDLNHSGILVSQSATVALIDADSFQFQAEGRTYHCLVGVPDFTAPELHGRSLNGVIRTKPHDNFALAVAIFQLLFMGRHPYAGRQSGSDLSLDQLIARNLFAYTRTRTVSVAPPAGVATLEDFPAEMANAFERSFGLDPQHRPSPSEWVGVLQALESQLTKCGANSLHFYPTAAKSCPWCRMEGASGVVLFVPSFEAIAAGTFDLGKFDVEKAWAIIRAIAIPEPESLALHALQAPTGPSAEAKKAKGRGASTKLVGVAIAAAALVCWAIYPEAGLLWVGLLIFAAVRSRRPAIESGPWQSRYAEADRRLDEAVSRWQSGLGLDRLKSLKADLERSVSEYRGLDAAKAQSLGRLKTERHNRQLHEFLDRFLIRRASIPGIGPAKTTTLASFGIESAADIKIGAIMAIPGFGQATAEKLLAWRGTQEKRFAYNPAPLPSDLQAQGAVERDYAAKAQVLSQKISGGQVELSQLAATVKARLAVPAPELTSMIQNRAQLGVDLEFLGISKPHKPAPAPATRPTAPMPPPVFHTRPLPSGPSGNPSCPDCGASMVRRTARRGHRRGNRFWGCSRYPACRGTRP